MPQKFVQTSQQPPLTSRRQPLCKKALLNTSMNFELRAAFCTALNSKFILQTSNACTKIHRSSVGLMTTRFLGACLVVILSSCTPPPSKTILSSGIPGGFYYRLGEQIHQSAQTSVNLTVQNVESQGSKQNLQRLLDRQADFALVQLDVAQAAMEEGKIQAVALLSRESVHIIARQEANLQTFDDLQGKRVAIGAPGSGIRFTTDQLVRAHQLQLRADNSGLEEAFNKLNSGQIDAIIYVGSVGANKWLRQRMVETLNLTMLPLQPALINHMTTQSPGFYQPATLPIGTYASRPPVPNRDIDTLATATVLVTRPDVNSQKIGLMTWSILSTARTYAQFYPELQDGDTATLLRQGLFYLHPAADEVFEQGDPRAALIRYWENNSDLQAGVFILGATSLVGFLFQRWRQERSKKLEVTTTNRISELKALLPEDPQRALHEIEDLRQEHRLQFIEGTVTSDIYEQLQQRTQTFADQCHLLLDAQRRKFVLDTLLLLDEWQATLQNDPEIALQKLSQIKQQYRDMLLANQVDIEAYVDLVELTLMSVMTLGPKASDKKTISTTSAPHTLTSSPAMLENAND